MEYKDKFIDKNITLYNMHCMELLKNTATNAYELAIVDPPYGSASDAVKTFTSNSVNKASKRNVYKQFNNTPPSLEYFKELKRVSKNQIIWGCNFYKDVDLTGGRLVWDKKGTAFGRAELAYLSMTKSVNIYEFSWNGMIQQNMKNKEFRIHPTQKPVKLYEWLLQNYAKEGDKILDTHLGSGSIAIACNRLKFSLTACELDSEYFKASVKRYKEQTAQQQLF